MSDGRFTKRPKPVEGESLSGYLMRASAKNNVEFRETIRLIKKESASIEIDRVSDLDNLLKEKFNIRNLSHITGLSAEQLLSMTFMPLYKKFLSDSSISKGLRDTNILSRHFEIHYRRYCPLCLKQENVYKLIWQIKEIIFCNVHHIPLMTECIHCGKKQPYISSRLGINKCINCDEDIISKQVSDIKENSNSVYHQQDWVFAQWTYLLDYKNSPLKYIDNMEYEIQMPLNSIYLFNIGKESPDILSFGNIGKRYKSLLLAYLKNRNHLIYLTPYLLIKFLKGTNNTCSDFFNLRLPEDFIQLVATKINIGKEELYHFRKIEKYKHSKIKENFEIQKTIKSEVDSYIRRREPETFLFKTEVYKYIRIDSGSITPIIRKYISDEVEKFNEKIRDDQISTINEIIQNIVHEQKPLTYKSVSEKIGLSIQQIIYRKDIVSIIKRQQANMKGK